MEFKVFTIVSKQRLRLPQDDERNNRFVLNVVKLLILY